MEVAPSRSERVVRRGSRRSMVVVMLVAAALLIPAAGTEAALGDGPIRGFKSTAYRNIVRGGELAYVRASYGERRRSGSTTWVSGEGS
ncbi:MAG TPA: hypothetical protein ENK19_05795 [Acidobacteria bacterium]|nr:hypothetical protein [Acidobacteriota bacterium]